jgi:flagellin-like protein
MKDINTISDNKGVSEVIGALVLTLIVIASLSAFFLFISEQQDEYQKNEELKDNIESETLIISDIRLFDDNPSDTTYEWNKIEITISSEWIKDSDINSISINDNELSQIWSFDPSTPGTKSDVIPLSSPIEIEKRDRFSFLIVPDDPLDYYQASAAQAIGYSDLIKIEINTEYLNTFSRTFIPPTALFLVDSEPYWDGSQWLPMVTMDGTSSYTSDERSYLVSWDWTIINDKNDDSIFDPVGVDDGDMIYDKPGERPPDPMMTGLSGAKLRIDNRISSDPDAELGHLNQISLTVTDNNGITSIVETVVYTI